MTKLPLASQPRPRSSCLLQAEVIGRRWPVAALFFGITGTTLLGGCTRPSNTSLSSNTSNAPSSASNTISTPAQTDWGTVIANWWKRYNSPVVQPTPRAARYTAFPLDSITATHPALQLIGALRQERDTHVSIPEFADGIVVGSPISLPHLLPGASRTTRDSTRPAFPSGDSIEGGLMAGSARSMTIARLGELQNEARIQSISALDEFFNGVAEYQKGVRNERESALRAAIEDEIAVSRTALLAQLSPLLPSDAIILEMTNLRLKLLPEVEAPEAEKIKAQQRLDFLEMQWAAILRKQENERLSELRRLIEERPKRLREEGETEIRRILADLQTRDTDLRTTAREEQRERVAIDFADPDDRLGIVQPAFSASASGAAASITRGGRNNSRTFSGNLTSINRLSLPDFSPIPLPEGATPAERATFNAQAQRVRRLLEADAGSWRKVSRIRDRAYRSPVSTSGSDRNGIDKQSG